MSWPKMIFRINSVFIIWSCKLSRTKILKGEKPPYCWSIFYFSIIPVLFTSAMFSTISSNSASGFSTFIRSFSMTLSEPQFKLLHDTFWATILIKQRKTASYTDICLEQIKKYFSFFTASLVERFWCLISWTACFISSDVEFSGFEKYAVIYETALW